MIAIFSYHSEDPDGVQGMQWHGIEQRGAQSLKLLSAQNSHIKIPTDAISIDFIANRVSKTIFITDCYPQGITYFIFGI
jgi:hypothetical protein